MKIIKYLLILAFVATFCSCETILESPNDQGVDPTLVNVELGLTIDVETQLFTKYVSAKTATAISTRSIVAIYEADRDDRIGETPVATAVCRETIVFGEEFRITTALKLNARRYRVLIWTDFTEGAENDYYTTSDLQKIHIKRPYNGSTDLKDGFSGAANIDLTPYRDQWDVKMNVPMVLDRPFAKIEVIATDLEMYAEKLNTKGVTDRDLSVKFIYSNWFPSGYNVSLGKPNDAQQGIWFNSRLTMISNEEALIAFDYVFVNGIESMVQAQMIIYDRGVVVNTVEEISIPIKRGKLTTIKGDFLTRDYKPGIHIDPEWEKDETGEFDIVIKD